MADELILKPEEHPKIAEVAKALDIKPQVGDVWIKGERSYDVIRVVGFAYIERYKEGHRERVIVEHQSYHGDEMTWVLDHDGLNVRDFGRNDFAKLWAPLEELWEDAEAELQRMLTAHRAQEEQAKVSGGTELMVRHTPQVLMDMRDNMALVHNKITALQHVVARKLSIMRWRMQEMKRYYEEQLGELRKVIEVLELYLGWSEQIVTIQDGALAPGSTPIRLYQNVLYMDEESGVVDLNNRGDEFNFGFQAIRWDTIDVFDRWVIEHIDLLLPSPKGVVFMRPTRHSRQTGNMWRDAEERARDRMVYVLIRNGDRISRIETELHIGDRMFPTTREWQKIQNVLMGIKEEREFNNEDLRIFSDRMDVKQAAKEEFDYKKTIVLLHGLIERATVLHPLPKVGINLFNEETYQDGSVEFIRDAEPSLTSGHPSYADWKKDINSRIVQGSRVFIGPISFETEADRRHRFSARVYENPKPGVYEVEEVEESKYGPNSRKIKILFKPKATVWSYNSWDGFDEHERKRRVGWWCTVGEEYVLNYDEFDPEIAEYYINSRLERRNYLSILPVLYVVMKMRLAEEEREYHFVKLIAAQTGKDEDEVWQGVAWWKFKNKWKRGLNKDDAKAMRMIIRWLNGAWRGEVSHSD